MDDETIAIGNFRLKREELLGKVMCEQQHITSFKDLKVEDLFDVNFQFSGRPIYEVR
jgi:hypothetical protein